MIFQKEKIFYILLTFLGIFILFQPPTDPDFGWHFKYGEYIVQNRQILRDNIFSYTMPDYKWANSYWIAQISMYSLYTLTGTIGMGFIFSAATTVCILTILNKSHFKKWQIFVGSMFIFIFLSQTSAIVRPLLFSSIFLLFLVHIIIYKPNNIKYLPLLFIIWANTHADFTLGLMILGIYNLQLLFSHGIKKEYLTTHISSLLCIFITLINPYGIHLWETLLKETHPFQFNYIREWLPLNTNEQADLTTMYFTFGVMAVALIELKDKKEKLWLLIASGIFLILSIRFSYFLRVAVLVGIFPLLMFLSQQENLVKKLFDILGEKNRDKVLKGIKVSMFLIFVSAGTFFGAKVFVAADEHRWEKKGEYPYEAIQTIRDLGLKGNMFNEYTWGGYLSWKLPEHKNFIDGRMPSWREKDFSVFEDYIEIMSGTEKSLELLDKYDISFILVKENSELKIFFTEDFWEDISQESYQLFIRNSAKVNVEE